MIYFLHKNAFSSPPPKNRYLTPQDAVLVEDVGAVEERGEEREKE